MAKEPRRRFDWDNLSALPRRRQPIRDIDALSQLKARRVKRKPGKAHATKADIAHLARAKRKRAKAKIAAISKRVQDFKAAARAYWRGETDEHP